VISTMKQPIVTLLREQARDLREWLCEAFLHRR
jgi:hypothetical protein